MKQQDDALDCIHYYILLKVAEEEIPIWLSAQLLLVHFISTTLLDTFIYQTIERR